MDQFSGTPVDRYVYCLVLPRVFLHDTKVGERAWDLAKGTYSSAFDFRRGENARHLVEQGNDPVRVLGERAHQQGLQYFVSQRMNDAHFAYSKEGPEKNFWTGNLLASAPGVAHRRRHPALFPASLRLLPPPDSRLFTWPSSKKPASAMTSRASSSIS